MRLPAFPSLACSVALGLLLLGTGSASADRLHFDSGGYVDVTRWWVDGSNLFYDGAAGTVGVPRSIVVRIETTAANSSRTAGSSGGRSGSRGSRRDVEQIRTFMQEANDALQRRDFETASSRYFEVIEAAPDLIVAWIGYASCELALGNDATALSAVLDGLSREPERAELLELLGELRYRDDRIEDALRAYRRAFDNDPNDRIRDKVLKLERELNANRDFDFAASSHFNVRYDGDVDVALASAAIDYLEEQYWLLTDRFRHTPLQPISVELYPRRAFREVTQTPEWVGGIYDGKIRVPLGGLARLHDGAKRVLAHELTHAIVHTKSRGNAPRWLHEGLAQISEGKRSTAADLDGLSAWLRGRPQAEWRTIEFSYPQALSLARYLDSLRGTDGLCRLLDELAEGKPIDEALGDVYGSSADALYRGWGRFVLGGGR